MPVATVNHRHLVEVPSVLGWPVATAGLLAVFATYWDEAWHTDVGRDSAWAAPHQLLYGSVAVVGIGVAFWGLLASLATRSLRATLGQPALLAAGLGALGALAAAPIDAAWHEAYGRDAVLFSPPHMLVVLASTALVLGVLAGLPSRARALRVAGGVLLLANAVAVVFEYEADVPQFSEIYYLPLLLLVGVAAAWVLRALVPVALPATVVVVGYGALRLAISGALLALGRSTPDLPIAVLGLVAFDLPLRRTSMRVAAAVVATSTFALAASSASVASPVAANVGMVAVPAIAVALVFLLVASRRGLLVAPLLLVTTAVLTVSNPEPAEAHDPGQGEPVGRAVLIATTSSDGSVELTVKPSERCRDLEPRRVVARRAGQTVVVPFDEVGPCSFGGRLSVPDPGRWFVYAEFAHQGEPVEGWLPVDVGEPETLQKSRELYRPAGEGVGVTVAQGVSGALVYAVGLGLLAVGLRATRSRRQA
jgi:hypothetical protein